MTGKGNKSRLTRERILRVGREYFIEHGYKESLVSDVAAEADIDRRTIYRYFPSKEVLLLSIISEMFDDFTSLIKLHEFTKSHNAYQKIEELFGMYFEYIKMNPDLIILLGMIDSNLSGESFRTTEFQELSSYGSRLDVALEELIIEGQYENSVNNNYEPRELAVTINNSLLALATRTAIYSMELKVQRENYGWKLLILQGKRLLDSLKVK